MSAPSKPEISPRLIFFLALLGPPGALAAGGLESPGLVSGPASCSTSGCHGGASESSRQFAVWSQRDVHTRAYATLTNARSARMAEALQLGRPAENSTCTACHAPLQTVAPALRAADAHVEDGVACASCHGTGDSWLRSHTRPDWTHADRVAAGMSDVRHLYGRANSCVACHQNIDPRLVTVGKHPALIFELDGQSVAEPKHWREPATAHGAQAWFVGQAVALREMSSALAHDRGEPGQALPRWAGLHWVLQHCALDENFSAAAAAPDAAGFAAVLAASDSAARRAADLAWSHDLTKTLLKKLAATHAAFLDSSIGRLEHARRAERLVLALDRLLASLPAAARPAGAQAPLDSLFSLAQSAPDFAPADFARELAAFERAL
ncbi:MAG: hypothetical protein HY302_04600 [Opitutae bacterium]|nr:hypothetical protein [Opitutae bacterium]